MPTFDLTGMQFEIVYDSLSFTLASMMATTIFLWFRVSSMTENYKTPLLISGLVTFIAAYHYFRIFASWENAYTYGEPTANGDGSWTLAEPTPSGVPFSDAYRYIDWLMTVPLLLMEIVLVMKLDRATANSKCFKLGLSSAIMVVIGYPGELILEKELLWQRWGYWVAAMIPFLYIVYELMIGLSGALNDEEDRHIRNKIWWAQRITVVSWLTYPVVYIIPMFGAEGAAAVVGIQIGYCVSDIISKCGVGLFIYQITLAKSRAEMKGLSSQSPLMATAKGVTVEESHH